MGKQTTKLTGTEWALLRDIGYRMHDFLIAENSDGAVFRYLIERTLAWKRFATELVAVHLTNPDAHSHSYGVLLPRSSAYRGLETLIERGIVFSEKRKTLRTLTINWPAILRRHIDQLESLDLTVNTKRLESLYTTVSKEFENMKLKSRTIAFTRELKTKEPEESFTLGDETHAQEDAKKTKQTKKKLALVEKRNAEDITVHAFREYYETLSREENKCIPAWDSKEYGQVKNYLAECKREGRDPIQIVGIAIRYWGKLSNYLGDIADDFFVHDGMLWHDFYNLRGHIYDWIWYTKSGRETDSVCGSLVWEALAANGTPVVCTPESHRIKFESMERYLSCGE